MYLAELEIFGFKSFPQKTVFKFSGGITALVGPNGCGKTNIVDAIRWVLGEQKSSVLRSDTMDNVIFNGTTLRRPLGMAEVNMKIENTRNILPTEYSEVNITRRIFRSGDSNYLLNKTKCRMKDIHELFMDTGMGSDSYSVIELKMVEAILSGKVEERRHLFEEAAGITKYKQRRKEAGNKLNRVKEDLDRVRDIVAEISKNVGTLGRQASKTKRYNLLLSELKVLEMDLLKHEFYEFNSKIKEFDLVHQGIESQIIQYSNNLEVADSQYNLLKETFSSVEANYLSTQENEKLLNTDFTNKNRDIAVAEEKKKSLISAQERIRIEIT
ncbi:MAG: AAA family ATPase, partial [Candidatus Kapabacteria bacterium]|nr:AAA family ATPase [Candidatus Kapabacteria bacterium]